MEENKLTQEQPFELPFRILVTAAHPDDIEFGVGGSVARWTAMGAEVIYCLVTDGSAGSNDPDVNLEELIQKRREEQIAAAAVVGVHDVRFLGHKDGTLEPTMDLRRDLTRVIRDVKPNRVVCQDPTTVFAGDFYINHPDHRAAGEATVYAVFPSSETRPIFPELLAEGYEPHKVDELYLDLTYSPNLYVDISETVDRKIDSLRAHVSQLGTGEDFENGAAKWVRQWSEEGGKALGVGAAEQFRVMRFNQRNPADEETAQAAVQPETETLTTEG